MYITLYTRVRACVHVCVHVCVFVHVSKSVLVYVCICTTDSTKL